MNEQRPAGRAATWEVECGGMRDRRQKKELESKPENTNLRHSMKNVSEGEATPVMCY